MKTYTCVNKSNNHKIFTTPYIHKPTETHTHTDVQIENNELMLMLKESCCYFLHSISLDLNWNKHGWLTSDLKMNPLPILKAFCIQFYTY